jgi:hypothetical protein
MQRNIAGEFGVELAQKFQELPSGSELRAGDERSSHGKEESGAVHSGESGVSGLVFPRHYCAGLGHVIRLLARCARLL